MKSQPFVKQALSHRTRLFFFGQFSTELVNMPTYNGSTLLQSTLKSASVSWKKMLFLHRQNYCKNQNLIIFSHNGFLMSCPFFPVLQKPWSYKNGANFPPICVWITKFGFGTFLKTKISFCIGKSSEDQSCIKWAVEKRCSRMMSCCPSVTCVLQQCMGMIFVMSYSWVSSAHPVQGMDYLFDEWMLFRF